MSARAQLAVAILAIGVGLWLGFNPVHSGGYDCGAPFGVAGDYPAHPSVGPLGEEEPDNQCDSERSHRRLAAGLSLGVGVLSAGLAGLMVRGTGHPDARGVRHHHETSGPGR